MNDEAAFQKAMLEHPEDLSERNPAAWYNDGYP
jgi:hypothetical protein